MGTEGSWEPAGARGPPGQRSSSEPWLKGVHWLKEQTRKEARDWGTLARAEGVDRLVGADFSGHGKLPEDFR